MNWPEIGKQIGDQILHILMGIASVYLLALMFGLVPAVIITVIWEAAREWKQWPSSRWYDPYLDWVFEIAGIALGVMIWIHLN